MKQLHFPIFEDWMLAIDPPLNACDEQLKLVSCRGVALAGGYVHLRLRQRAVRV
jgi:hypothetical protein